MRIKNSIKNIKYNLIFYIFNLFFLLIFKKVFISNLGAETTGLNDLFKNLIGFLNIAELGILDSVIFLLYRALKEKDYDKLNSILATYRYLYRAVAAIIFAGSLIVCIFINSMLGQADLNIGLVRLYFIIFAITPVTTYLLAYNQVVAIADQKSYIVTKNFGIFNILRNVVQILVMVYGKSYLVYLVLEIIFNVSALSFINLKIINKYTWINLKTKEKLKDLIGKNKQILTNTRNLFFHKIGGFVLLQTDNIVISCFINLKSVAAYSSYIMITNAITQLFYQITNGSRASIGDLLVENDSEKSFSTWKGMFLSTVVFGGVICICFYIVVNDFISLWIGKEFVLDNLAVTAIVINLIFALIRQSTDVFKDGYGIFHDTWAPSVEVVVNLAASIILVQKLGIAGVVIGTNISNFLIVFVWKPFIVFKEGFKKSIRYYWQIVIKASVLTAISVFITYASTEYINRYFADATIINLIIKSGIAAVIASLAFITTFIIDKDFRSVFFRCFKAFEKVFKTTG